MSEQNGAAEEPALQFERAELGDAPRGGVTCAICQGQIADAYFQVNGAVACSACKDGVVAARKGGSRARRLLAAGGLGLLAAIVGAAIWIGIVRVTGYEIGLVAIGVGILVGTAVRRGSGGRGGWGYQTLAVVLTYSAMVAYYVPYVIDGLRRGSAEHAASETTPAPDPAAAQPSEAAPPSGAAPVSADPAPEVSFLGILLALAVVVGIVFAAPFLAGAENIIGILILLFALYEAWKLNRRQELTVAGPFQVASAGAAAPAPTA